MIPTSKLSVVMTTYESKKKIEAAIEYILPRVMKLDIEHELCTHVTCNRGPPSIPILSYALMEDGAGQDETVTHVTDKAIAVLEAILGKNFTITSLHSREDDFVRVNLYATYSNTPRAEDPAWIGEMWPRLNRIRVTDNRVVWDPLPRYNAEDWEKELLDKVAAADQFIKQAHSGLVEPTFWRPLLPFKEFLAQEAQQFEDMILDVKNYTMSAEDKFQDAHKLLVEKKSFFATFTVDGFVPTAKTSAAIEALRLASKALRLASIAEEERIPEAAAVAAAVAAVADAFNTALVNICS